MKKIDTRAISLSYMLDMEKGKEAHAERFSAWLEKKAEIALIFKEIENTININVNKYDSERVLTSGDGASDLLFVELGTYGIRELPFKLPKMEQRDWERGGALRFSFTGRGTIIVDIYLPHSKSYSSNNNRLFIAAFEHADKITVAKIEKYIKEPVNYFV